MIYENESHSYKTYRGGTMMFTKKRIIFFSILLLPMLIVSALLNFVYSLNSHDYLQVNWLLVIILALVLDVFFTWMQTRKDTGKKTE
jgi:hypothetical protein